MIDFPLLHHVERHQGCAPLHDVVNTCAKRNNPGRNRRRGKFEGDCSPLGAWVRGALHGLQHGHKEIVRIGRLRKAMI